MSKTSEKPIDCPSAQPEMDGARIFGMQTGSPGERQTGYLTEALPVSEKLLKLSGPAKPTQLFRVAAPCMSKGCGHFKSGSCTLAQRIVAGLQPVVESLPPCQIRSTCRWFRQEGKAACLRCPQVITDKFDATDHEKQIAAVPA